MIEKLETRRLLDADLFEGTLSITGTDFDDTIRIDLQGSRVLLLTSPEGFRRQYLLRDIRLVEIDCGDGNDFVQIDMLFTRSISMMGGRGDDTLVGARGNDTIDGGEGDDWLDGGFDLGRSRDILIGGLGIDLVDYRHQTRALKIDLDGNADDGIEGERDNVDPSVEIVLGGGGADVITSNLTDGVSLIGGSGNDTLNSSGGSDFLSGGRGNDYLNARGGDDILRGGPGTDTLIGGTGDDTADYGDRTEDLVITLDGLPNDGEPDENDSVAADIENVVGGNGNDRIVTTDAANFIDGRGGNDTLLGLGGDDSIIGSDGDDSMEGGAGNDTLDGGLGADVFTGGAGTDTATYRFRFENLLVSGDDIANDGTPRERDNVGSDIEVIEGGFGNDRLSGSAAANTLLGGFGNDTLLGEAGDDRLDGGPGNDVFEGGSGADIFIGAGGTDTVDYTSRNAPLDININDIADDGEGGELDNVSSTIEIVLGGSSDDVMMAGSRSVQFEGRAGNDFLFGGAGNDLLNGGDGDDFLDGAGGADIMIGGNDIDTVDYSTRTADLKIELDNMANDGANDNDNVMDDIELILCGSGDDEVTAGLNAITVLGNAGDDTLIGGQGNDELQGGDGNDSLIGSVGNDHLFGDAGNDVINAIDLIEDTIDGGMGTDVAFFDFVDTVLNVP